MKILRYLAYVVGGLAALLILCLALLPTVISSSFGNNLVQRLARSAYPGTITFDSLSLGWLNGLHLTKLHVSDEKGRSVASLEELRLDKPLFRFLFSPTEIGTLTIISPKVCLYQDEPSEPSEKDSSKENNPKTIEKELLNKQSSKHSTAQPRPAFNIIPLSGTVSLIDASLEIFTNNSLTGSIHDATCSVNADLPKKADLIADAILSSDGVKAPFHAEAQAIQSSPSAMKGTAKLSCNSIPTQLIGLFVKNIDSTLPQMLEEVLGQSFSVQCNASVDNGNLSCEALVHSLHLNSDLSFNYQNNLLTLKQGEIISASCTPSLFNLLSKYVPHHSQVSLQKEASFTIQNTIPLVVDCNTLTVASPAKITLSSPSQIHLIVGSENQPLTLSLNSVLSQTSQQTLLLADLAASSGSLNALLHAQTGIELNGERLTLDSALMLNGEWPILVEKIASIPASSIIGPSVALKASCQGFFEGIDLFSFSGQSALSSQNFQNTTLFSIDQNGLSIPSSETSANITNSLCRVLNLPIHTQHSAEALKATCSLQKCFIPIRSGVLNLEKASVEATTTFSIPAATILEGKVFSEPSTTTFSVEKSPSNMLCNFSLTSSFPCTCPQIPAVQTLLGAEGLHLTASGSLNTKTQSIALQQVCLSTAAIKATFPQMELGFSPLLSFQLNNPATITIQCSNDLFVAAQMPKVSLRSPFTISCTIDPFLVSFDKYLSSKTPIKGSLSTDLIRLSQFKETDSFTLKSPFSFDLTASTATLQTLIRQNEDTIIDSTSTLDLSGTSPKLFSKIIVDKLPISLLDVFTQKSLGTAIGSTIDSTIDCAFYGLSEKNNKVLISAKGDFWNAHIDFALDEMKLHADQPSIIRATVTPERLKAILQLCNKDCDITLVDPVTVTATIPECSADISHLLENNPSSLSYLKTLDTTSLQCAASIVPLNLSAHNLPLLSLESLNATVSLIGNKKTLSFAITSPKSQSTSLNIEGTVTDAWDDTGLRMDKLSVGSSINVANLPSATLEIAAPGKGALLAETLGPSLNVKGVVDIQKMTSGTVTLDCSSKNASSHCDAIVEKGILRLKNPAKASLSITKQAGELLLKNIAPFLSSAARSERPLEITIAPEGVLIPLQPFSPTTMRIPNITADLGKLIVKNGGTLKVILGVLGQEKAASGDEVNLWLTPLYASIENGLVNCKRTDILVADSIHMIYWGTANLHSNTLDMTVAIPDETLLKLHLIPVSLKPGTGVQIPITGPMDNPKVETTAALAKLAGAGVTTYVKDPQLQIFGALIQAAASAIDNGKPIPPPTTTPLPWESSSKR